MKIPAEKMTPEIRALTKEHNKHQRLHNKLVREKQALIIRHWMSNSPNVEVIGMELKKVDNSEKIAQLTIQIADEGAMCDIFMDKVKKLLENPSEPVKEISPLRPLRDYPDETPVMVKDIPKEERERFDGTKPLMSLKMLHEKLWMKTVGILESLNIITIDDFNYNSHELETHDDVTTRQLALIHRAVREYTLNSNRLTGE